MNNKKTYQALVTRMNELALVPPQRVGSFTFIYKRFVPYFKFSPWRSGIVLSFFSTALLYLLLGSTLVRIASILQFGF